jgi:flagellum-specific ATP synthase
MSDVIQKEHKGFQGKVLKAMALYRENEDLIQLGAYAKGTNPQLDHAIALHDELDAFLIQGVDEKSDYESCLKKLSDLAHKLPAT